MLRQLKENRGVDVDLEIAALENHPKVAKCCLMLHGAALACFLWVAAMFAASHAEFNSVEFRLDTDFLRWETKLPAVSVCQRAGKTSPPAKNSRSCQELFLGCLWNGRPFECCDHFKELVLQDSRCFSLNSLQTEERVEDTPFVVSGLDGISVFEFQFATAAQTFVHDPKAVVFSGNLSTPLPAEFRQRGVLRHLELAFTFKEVLVEDSAHTLTPLQRSCLLPGERTLRNHPLYSESACRVECLIRRQIETCGCSDHLLAIESRCDKQGTRCLAQGRRRLEGDGEGCACAPECEVFDVTIVRYSLSRGHPKRHSARLTLLSPPRERLTMYARASTLDALVAFACLSRLVTSASLLSVTESIFSLVRRMRSHQAALPSRAAAKELSTAPGEDCGDKTKLL